MATPDPSSPIVLRPALPYPPRPPRGSRIAVWIVIISILTVLFAVFLVVLPFLRLALFASSVPNDPIVFAQQMVQQEHQAMLNTWTQNARAAGALFEDSLVPKRRPKVAAPSSYGPFHLGMLRRDATRGEAAELPGVAGVTLNAPKGDVVEEIEVTFSYLPVPATDFYRTLIETYGKPKRIGVLEHGMPPTQTVVWEWTADDVQVILSLQVNAADPFIFGNTVEPTLTIAHGRMARERDAEQAREQQAAAEQQRRDDMLRTLKGTK